MIRIPIQIKNVGGLSERHLIRAADQADMIAGLQRALAYVTLSLPAGRVIERSTRHSSVQVLSQAPKSGSLIHNMIVEIQAHPDVYAAGAFTGVAPSVVANYITRFIDFVFKQAAGLLSDGEYDSFANTFERQEPYFDELVNKIEPHIAAAHAPINDEEKILITLNDENTIEFDVDTKEYTSASNWSNSDEIFPGHVTRLNLLTGNGRLYSFRQGKVLSFSQIDSFRSSSAAELLSWSLREKDMNRPADIEIMANAVTSNSGRIKRLWVRNARTRP